uniref:ATP synthase delta chain n=1 Tax=Davidia involucrata TaxID=16924 RepID=A0A5B7BR79_DAVIN
MDTLSSSVSSFKVPSLHSTSREIFYHLRTPNTSHLPPHSQTQVQSSATKPNSISNRATKSFTRNKFTTSPPFFTSSLKQSPIIVHHRAASGYAAALVDVARCNNSLEVVERDVTRFSKLLLRNEHLRANPSVGDKERGQLVKEVAEKGGFHRHLVVLLRMLVEKNKVGIVSEVLEEFERIYDQLSGTRVVLVSSAKRSTVWNCYKGSKAQWGYEGEGEGEGEEFS